MSFIATYNAIDGCSEPLTDRRVVGILRYLLTGTPCLSHREEFGLSGQPSGNTFLPTLLRLYAVWHREISCRPQSRIESAGRAHSESQRSFALLLARLW